MFGIYFFVILLFSSLHIHCPIHRITDQFPAHPQIRFSKQSKTSAEHDL